MKYLKTIQTVFKVFKTLFMVGAIVGFVGAGLALCSGITLLTGGDIEILKIGGTRILLPIDPGEAALTYGNDKLGIMCVSMFAGLLCAGILLLLASRWLSMELKEGTPFTKRAAVSMRNLGIVTAALAVVSMAVQELTCMFAGIPSDLVMNSGTVTTGLALILFSLVLHYGAELEASKNGIDNTLK